jgi:sugar lactone lactonase YvrE
MPVFSRTALAGPVITTIAGTGTAGYNADLIPATTAKLNNPFGVYASNSGNVYIAEYGGHRIRKIDPSSGEISTVAGTGVNGFNSDNISATTAKINTPTRILVDSSERIFIADQQNNRIRKVEAGIITTVIGSGAYGYGGEGVSATAVSFSNPFAIAMDASGTMYIVEHGAQRIRKVEATTGKVTTIAGTGTAGYNSDGIAATSAQLNWPRGIALDKDGNIFIADVGNARVRKVDAASGLISTYAGGGITNGNGITATAATLSEPYDVALDKDGNLYIAERMASRIRKVDGETHLISTIAGTGANSFSGDGGDATLAAINHPQGVAVDQSGNIYVADYDNQRVRKLEYGLSSSLALSTTLPLVGTWMTATLTVKYSGTATATAVTPEMQIPSGSSLLNLEAGPLPAGPQTISAGGTVAFSWTYSVSGQGNLVFTGSVSGLNEANGLNVSAYSTVPAIAVVPAKISGKVCTIPGQVNIGQSFLLTMTVTNTGGENVSGLSSGLLVKTGSGVATQVAGPNPSMPMPLGGGSSLTFTWTFTAVSGGDVTFSTSINGLAQLSSQTVTTGQVAADPLYITPLRGAIAKSLGTAATGQWVQYWLTVTNTGAGNVTGVMPGFQVNSGTLEQQGAVNPTGPIDLSAGASQTFTWTYSISGSGSINVTATATGLDDVTSGMTSVSASTALTANTPATLVSRLTFSTTSAIEGQWMEVRLTVTNTGQLNAVDATPGIMVTAGAASVEPINGPLPTGPLNLGPGGSQTFVWTYSISGAGLLGFQCAASATGQVDGLWKTTSSTGGYFRHPLRAALSKSLASPAVGQWITVFLAVTNTGAEDVSGVAAELQVNSGSMALQSGPSPAGPLTIASGGSQVFSWTYSVSGSGLTGLTATASGTDTATAGGTAGSASTSLNAFTPAKLAPAIALSSTNPVEGQWFSVFLTVTNTGQLNAIDVTPALQVATGASLLEYQSGPVPAGPVLLSTGASQTFTWTYSVSGQGSLGFSAGASATRQTDGGWISASAGINAVAWQKVSLTASMTTSNDSPYVGDELVVVCHVTNGGGIPVSALAPALQATQGAGLVSWISGPVPAGPQTLGAGAGKSFTWKYSVVSAGTAVFTATMSGIEDVSLAVRGATASRTVEIMDLKAVLHSKLPLLGQIQVRNNIIRIIRGQPAYIVIHGEPGKKVEAAIYSKSGQPLASLGGGNIVLDASGVANLEFDGRISGKPLATGSYWVVVSGAVNDRKPVIIQNK